MSLPMPELLVDFITSLDGYAAPRVGRAGGGLEGPEYLAWLPAHCIYGKLGVRSRTELARRL